MKKKRIIGISTIVVLFVIVGILLATFIPRTVNISDYLYVEVEGISGKGKLEYYIQDYFPDELGVKVKASKTNNISNGDIIKFDISWNDEKCKEYGINLKNGHYEWKVEGLADYSNENGEEKTEGHKFYATADMNDEVAKVMLDAIYSSVEEELNFLNNGESEPVINECSILGIYADDDTGYGSSVLSEFTVSNEEWNKKVIYLCSDFYELYDYVTGSDISTLSTEYLDALEYKTDNYFGTSTFYAESRKEVDSIMKQSNYSLVEYKYTKK
jgi:hypothetical protein